ncbi:MAG: hypothetical protein LCI02_13940 [Proteobacteria bacterium]|nr:hypothetical protein [Pseudomonadota bacterium]
MADSTSSGSAPDSGGESADGSPEALARQASEEARRRPADRWRVVTKGPETCVNWQDCLSTDRHIDPYLVWADVTRFAGFQRQLSRGDKPLALAIEFRHRLNVLTPQTCQNPTDRDDPDLLLCELDIPGIYFTLDDGHTQQALVSRFVTARAQVETVARLLKSPSVRRMQLGLPRIGNALPERARLGLAARNKNRVIVGVIDDGVPFAHPSLCDGTGAARLRFLWDQEASRPVNENGWQDVRRAGYGAELQHPALTAASRTARAANSQSLAYAQVNYGPVQLGLDLFGTMFQQPASAASGTIRDLPVGSMRAKTHGAGVMFLAAGTMADEPTARAPIAETLTPLQWQRAQPSADRTCDYADKWPLIFVQLPTRTILDTSGGSLAVHVLDGIRYILDRADCIPDAPDGQEPDGAVDIPIPGTPGYDPNLPRNFAGHSVIINISYGSTAGPHDGTSIVEQAIVDLVAYAPDHDPDSGHRDSTWVCVAAGNSHGSLTHAVLALPAGKSKSFVWTVGPDNPLQTFLEIWIPDVDLNGDAITRQRQERFVIELRPPAGSAMRPVRVTSGEARVWQEPDPLVPPTAGVIFARKVAQGLRGTMVLVAVAPTRTDPNFGTAAPHGRWYVDVTDQSLESESRSDVAVHAWAERNDLVYGNRRGQQATVFGDDPVPEVTEFTPPTADYLRTVASGLPAVQMTDQLQGSPELASLAGVSTPLGSPFFCDDDARGRVVVVGAHRIADGEVSRYSSGGPSRHQGRRSLNVPLPNFSPQPPGVTPVFSAPRNRPDVTAPADLSPAAQGLRVAGMRAGQWSRLSGTSAAAPSVARAIANAQYDFTYGKSQIDCGVDSDRLAALYGLHRTPAAGDAASRPTPTPAKDDLFRRADWIVK